MQTLVASSSESLCDEHQCLNLWAKKNFGYEVFLFISEERTSTAFQETLLSLRCFQLEEVMM